MSEQVKAGDKVWVLCKVIEPCENLIKVTGSGDDNWFWADRDHCRPVETPVIKACLTTESNFSEVPDGSSEPLAVGDAVVVTERSHKWRGVRGRIVSVSESNEFPLEFISDCRKRLGYFRSSSIRKIEQADPINPSHYKHLPAEAIDIIESAIAKAPSNQSAFLQGQVIKYLLRCWSKKGIEDLRKAKWYLDRLVSGFDDLLAEASGANDEPTCKRYRTPTLADLANGPIACEYRGCDDEHWRGGFLVHVLNGAIPFLCVDEQWKLSGQWEQCQIEVGE